MINKHDFPPVVGVDMGGAQARAAVLNIESGDVRLKVHLSETVNVPVTEDQPPEDLIQSIHDAVKQAVLKAGLSLDEIKGIGVGVPAPANIETGEVFYSSNLLVWECVPLRDKLAELFQPGKPSIVIDNDANAGALGEYLFGAGYNTSHMVYLTVSTGIGAGIIVDGKLMRGKHGNAAEMGHMIIKHDSDRTCVCGNAGCLESLASGRAIYEKVKGISSVIARLRREGGNEHMLIDVLRCVSHMEDQNEVKDVIDEAARDLGIGLLNIVHIFDPEKIILGGSVVRILGPEWIKTAQRVLFPQTGQLNKVFMKKPREAIRFPMAALDDKVGLVGAGALVYRTLGYM